ncbi:MAG: hypothetical protein ACPGVX_11620 [Thalassobaculaceae bacterium]
MVQVAGQRVWRAAAAAALALGLIMPAGAPRAAHQGGDSHSVIALSFECQVIVLKRDRRYVIAWWQRGVWPRVGDEIVGNISTGAPQSLLDQSLGLPLIVGVEARDLTMKQALANFRALCP